MISLHLALFLIIVVSLFMAANGFIMKTKNSKTNLCSLSTKKYTLVTKKFLHFPLLSSCNDDFDELEFSKSPLNQFLHVLQDSIINESLLKLTLSENDSSGGSDGDGDGLISTIDMTEIEEWKAISGRLIKIKSATKQLQLNCYKDKRMQKSDKTETYTTSEEAVEVVKLYITKAFKKVMLSTKESDFELKMRKGQGKFRSTSKGFDQMDVESIKAETIPSNDPGALRRILEDRRLLLLSDPSNQEYKILYAEAKQRSK